MQITRRFTPKPPTDNDFLMFDFGDPEAVNEAGDVGANLAQGETIAASPAPAVTSSLYPYAVQPASPGALTIVGATIQDGPTMPASRVVTNVQPSGTAGAEYLVTCTVTTSSGRVVSRSARLPVAVI